MKDYLKNKKPRISLFLVSILFISNILTFFSDGLYQTIILFPKDIQNVSTWYKLLTYPLYVGGLIKWIHSGIVIIIAGYIIEHRLSKAKVISLIVLSSIIGGLIFSSIKVNDPLNTPIASPTMITWGMSTCAFILIVKKIKTSMLFEKLLVGCFIFSLLTIEFIDNGFLIGQIGVMIFGLLYGLIFDKGEPQITRGSLQNLLADELQIPFDFKERLLFFKYQVNEYFDFLKEFDYFLDEEQYGRSEDLTKYFSEFKYKNGDTVVKINFYTDIFNGNKKAYPKLTPEELPIIDSLISCSIWDKKAFMSIPCFIELKYPQISYDNFMIKLDSSDLEKDISRVMKNYSDFFKNNLTSVLQKKIIYDCYTDRFYDIVFKEIQYQ